MDGLKNGQEKLPTFPVKIWTPDPEQFCVLNSQHVLKRYEVGTFFLMSIFGLIDARMSAYRNYRAALVQIRSGAPAQYSKVVYSWHCPATYVIR